MSTTLVAEPVGDKRITHHIYDTSPSLTRCGKKIYENGYLKKDWSVGTLTPDSNETLCKVCFTAIEIEQAQVRGRKRDDEIINILRARIARLEDDRTRLIEVVKTTERWLAPSSVAQAVARDLRLTIQYVERDAQ